MDKVTLAKPYSGKSVLVENLEIDASKVSRVVDISDNQTVVIRNCKITGTISSVIEGHAQGTTITLENVTVGDTDRYVCYLESRASDLSMIYDRQANTVNIKGCNFASSFNETPVRLMAGVYGSIQSTTIMDIVDKVSDKANQGLRLHCYAADLTDSTFGKWTKIGANGDTPEDYTRKITATNCNFVGGIRTQNLHELYLIGGSADGTAGSSGYAIGTGEGFKDPTKISITGMKLVGKTGPAFTQTTQTTPMTPMTPATPTQPGTNMGYKVTGQITQNGKAAAGAVVTLQGSNQTPSLHTTTDASGNYSFSGVAAGWYSTVAGNAHVSFQVVNKDLVAPVVAITLATAPATPTTPTTPVTPNPDPTHTVVRGTIIDSDVAASKAKEAGFTLWRDWCSVNWSTGKINDAKDIEKANAKVKAGWKVILTVTPDETANHKGDRCADFKTVADQLIDGGLDKSVIVQLVNEANLDTYWPKGDVGEATRLFAVPIATKLKAAGYTVAAPSITYGEPSGVNNFVAIIMANTPRGLWDYLDAHLYADLNQFKVTFAAWSVLAKKYSAKLMASEWSHKVGNKAFAPEVGDFIAVMDKYCDIHCWFSFCYGAKFNPLNPYAYKDGATTEVFDAIKKAIKG